LQGISPDGGGSQNIFGREHFLGEEKEQIRAALTKRLGFTQLSERPGAGNSRYTYIESWKAIENANLIFGFNGWSCSVVDVHMDFLEQDPKNFKVGVSAVVRVTLKDGTFHEDVGFGSAENPRKGTAIENAKKEAITDARKRALRMFGNALGNCIYDKQYLKRVKTMKTDEKGFVLEDEPQSKPNGHAPMLQQQPQQPQQSPTLPIQPPSAPVAKPQSQTFSRPIATTATTTAVNGPAPVQNQQQKMMISQPSAMPVVRAPINSSPPLSLTPHSVTTTSTTTTSSSYGNDQFDADFADPDLLAAMDDAENNKPI